MDYQPLSQSSALQQKTDQEEREADGNFAYVSQSGDQNIPSISKVRVFDDPPQISQSEAQTGSHGIDDPMVTDQTDTSANSMDKEPPPLSSAAQENVYLEDKEPQGDGIVDQLTEIVDQNAPSRSKVRVFDDPIHLSSSQAETFSRGIDNPMVTDQAMHQPPSYQALVRDPGISNPQVADIQPGTDNIEKDRQIVTNYTTSDQPPSFGGVAPREPSYGSHDYDNEAAPPTLSELARDRVSQPGAPTADVDLEVPEMSIAGTNFRKIERKIKKY